jgi:rhamnosyltransferase
MPTAAIVVTYRPEAVALQGVRALRGQVEHVIVADNGSGEESRAFFDGLAGTGAVVLRLGANLGVGAAHNAGVTRARALGASHVLLLDQDSVPAPDMVGALLHAEARQLAQGAKVAGVGPVYYDQRVGKAWPFYRLFAVGMKAQHCTGQEVIPCDFLISSGSLIRLAVLDEVGGMNEGYFLEHVDTEWALRAKARGYSLFGVCAAKMLHSLGDDAVDVPLANRRVQVYQPYRAYYLYRNAILLWRQPFALLPWKLNELKRLLLRLVFFSMLVPPRLLRLRYMLLGLWHGLRGRTGRLEPGR